MEISMCFFIDELLRNQFKSKIGSLGLKQKDVLTKLIGDYIKNE